MYSSRLELRGLKVVLQITPGLYRMALTPPCDEIHHVDGEVITLKMKMTVNSGGQTVEWRNAGPSVDAHAVPPVTKVPYDPNHGG